MWNKLSLRTKLTVLTAIIITAVCVCLTLVSMFNAKRIIYLKQHVHFTEGRLENMPADIKEELFLLPADTKKAASDFDKLSILYMILFIVFGTAATYIVAGLTLKPIDNLSKQIEKIDEHNLKTPLNIINNGVETARLTSAFNHMLSKLDTAFESQKRFSQNVAHELKTPLSSIRANIEVLELQENPCIDEYQEVIDVVKENAERLIQIVSELLTLDTVLCNEQLTEVGLHEMVEHIFSELDTSIKAKKITVLNKLTATSSFKGDSALIYHAFINLLQNAIKYNKDEGAVYVYSERNSVIIEDTGIGISASELDKIFEPFYCVDTSRSRSLGGSGLGLSVVKAIVEKHSGSIVVESDLGVGTKVIITI